MKRYFITRKESGELCLLSGLLGENRDIFFPKLSENLHLTTFSEIAVRYLEQLGFEPFECESESEARDRAKDLIKDKKWPCYFFQSDTTGEKDFEEFYMDGEDLDTNRFITIGVIRNKPTFDQDQLKRFSNGVDALRSATSVDKVAVLELFREILPEFSHQETGKYLDQKM